MQPTSKGKPRGNKTNTCGTRRARRTRGLHPQAQPEATCKSPGTHSTNVQRAPVHLPCAGVPYAAPCPPCLAAPRAPTVVVVVAAAEVPAVVALVGVVAMAVAAAWVAVEDTWVAAGTRGAGTCTGRTHTGGSRRSKALFPDPSSSAGTCAAAHTRTAADTDTHTAAATPPNLCAEHVERTR